MIAQVVKVGAGTDEDADGIAVCGVAGFAGDAVEGAFGVAVGVTPHRRTFWVQGFCGEGFVEEEIGAI